MRSLGLRPKLNISQPGDPDELQADRMADAFVRGQTMAGPARASTDDELRRKHDGAAALGASANTPAPLARAASDGGSPLSAATRAPYERFFRADLSHVRIHDNAAANHAARAFGAKAFARGSDLYFGNSHFDTTSSGGRSLLVHELAHVMQSGGEERLRRETDEELDEKLLKRLQAVPEFNAIDQAPTHGGLESWSERFPRSFEEMKTRAVGRYGETAFDALMENDAEILVLVQTSDVLISRLYDLAALYDTDAEAAHEVIDRYLGVDYLYGAEDFRGIYDLTYSYFGEQFQQDPEFDLGLFQELLTRDIDDLIADVESEADAAQRDADADAEDREAWIEAAQDMLGTVVAKREDIFFDDELSLETLLDPQEGSAEVDEAVAIARFSGGMAAVVKVGDRYHAYKLSEDFDRSDIFLGKDWDFRTEIVRHGPGGDAVHAIVTEGGFVATPSGPGSFIDSPGGNRFVGGDQARDPMKHLEADTKLLESGRAAELGISPIVIFTSMVRNVALVNLRQAEQSMSQIQRSVTSPAGIGGIFRAPDAEKGEALQRNSARLRELTLQAERLAQELGDEMTDEQAEQRDAILGEMGAILKNSPAAGFFVINDRDPDDDHPVEDDEVSDELKGLSGEEAATKASDEAKERKENIALVRRAMFDDPDIVLGFDPLHAMVMSQFSETDQLLIRGSMALKTLEDVAGTIGLLALDVSLLIAGFFTGGSAWAGITLSAAGTGLSAIQLNQQLIEAERLSAMAELDAPGGVQLATPEQARSARNWAIFGVALNFLGLVGLARGAARLIKASQREGTLVGRIAARAGVADEVMQAALRRSVLGAPRPDPGALRQIVLARLPEPLQRRYANLVIDVLDEERWAAQFGRDSAQHAATRFATRSTGELYPTVVMFRARGNVLALQEEAMHIAQAADPTIAARIARGAELSVDAWSRMSRAEKLDEIRNVLELEKDVQQRLLRQAERAGDTEGVDDALEEISEISEQIARVDDAIANPGAALPAGVDLDRAPLFLFNKPRLPRQLGTWSGLEGNSVWNSQHPDVIAVTGGAGIRFRNGYPDFSPHSVGRVNIGQTGGASDFAEADRLFAEGIARGSRAPPSGYTRADFMHNGEPVAAGTARYRRAAGLTWHHHQGGRQMLLVPTRLHANVPHTGGASAARAAQ